MSLTKRYQQALEKPDMVHDTAQELAVERLESLSLALREYDQRNFLHVITSLIPPFNRSEQSISGLYLWGGVGRGKTWLMNMFYDELDITEKKRVHFHRFMLEIHDELANRSRRKDPLKSIAERLSKKYRVLCIDEFIVTNITDAMILSELLQALFAGGICLIATSNRRPDDLYLNGLQRERFLPAIDLIKTHTEIMHIEGDIDHRVALLEQADVYYHPIDEDTEQQIHLRMQELSISEVIKAKPLTVLDREIDTIYCSEDVVWFDFATICSAPRAAQDYIELAVHFNTVIITGIPVLDEYSDDKVRRFIYLIDDLYDRRVKLIASADAEPEQLYHGSMLEFAFHRTSSRLIEMRSHSYLLQAHKPFLE